MSTITTDTLKQFRRGRPLVAGNRDLGLLRAAFNWAILGGLLRALPVPDRRRARHQAGARRAADAAPAARRGRTAHAGRLHASHDLITAALETGMRKGEMLSLQWHQVRFTPRAEVFLPAAKTKAKRDRRVPISSVLLAVLRASTSRSGRRTSLGPEAYVFGDEIGRRRADLKTGVADRP